VSWLAQDHEGSFWVGTESSSLIRMRDGKVQTLNPGDGLSDDNVRAVLPSRDGSVWIATDRGVDRWRDGRVEPLSFEGDSGLEYPRALAEDDRGRLWIGTLRGAGRLQDERFTPVKLAEDPVFAKTRAICVGRDDAVWFGTVSGLFRLDAAASPASLPTTQIGRHDVYAVIEDRQGRLWAGTNGDGLCVVDQGQTQWLRRTDRLCSDVIHDLHEDAEGAIWVGTSAGLNRLRDGHIDAFTTRHGLPDNLVNQVVADGRGWLWIGHDRGVYRVRKQDLSDVANGRAARVRPVVYDLEDGLPSLEINGQVSHPAAAIRCRFRIAEDLPTLTVAPAKRSAVAAVCREALNNIVKHARASEVRLTVQTVDSRLQVIVEDDGQGFDAGAVLAGDRRSQDPSGGNGLENMRTRLDEIGGRCLIDSQPGRGARVTLTLPLG